MTFCTSCGEDFIPDEGVCEACGGRRTVNLRIQELERAADLALVVLWGSHSDKQGAIKQLEEVVLNAPGGCQIGTTVSSVKKRQSEEKKR